MASKIITTGIGNDSAFASSFSITNYEKDVVSHPILNIWKDICVNIKTEEKQNTNLYYNYQVIRKDTLESISNFFYKTQNYWWLILVVNDCESPFDFIDNVLMDQASIKILKVEHLPKILTSNKTNDISEYLGMRNVN